MADRQAVELVEGDVVAVAVVRPQRVEHRSRVVDRGVQLARQRVALVIGQELRQRAVALGQCRQRVERGQHAGVGTPEVAEVEVAAVLAAEDGVGLGHRLLDEAVAHAGPHRGPAQLADQLGHAAARDQVVDHRGAGVAAQLPLGDQRRQRRGRDHDAALVDEEAAVGVAVERQADVGALLDDARLEVDQRRRVNRVRLVVGERAVELEVHRHQLDLLVAEQARDGRHRQPGHAVAGVGHDREPTALHRRELEQVGGVRRQHVLVAHRAGPPRNLRVVGEDPVADVGEAGVAADRDRPGAAHLDAVVAGRVVARGEHRARQAERAGREVELVGGAQPDHEDVGAGRGRALGERLDQLGRARPHVVADHDLLGTGHLDERPADGTGEPRVELLGDEPPHVVRLEDGVEVGGRRHGAEPIRRDGDGTTSPVSRS